jgi:2,5-dihydroxypyridine 5,6-dioxygenase
MAVQNASHLKTAELVPLFERMLRLCKLETTESLLILTEPDSNQEYAAAMFGAGRSLGADVSILTVPSAPPEQVPVIRTGAVSSSVLKKAHLALDVLKRADFVIDLTSGGLLHSEEQGAVLASGTRMLMVHDPVEALERMFPTEHDRQLVQRGVARLKAAKEVRLTSDSGTDLTLDKTDRPVFEQHGFVDQPGTWDHWPSAFQFTIPTEGSAEGVLVMDAGDIWYPMKRFITSEVRMTFEKGVAVEIAGGYDAFLIRDYIENWHDPEGYAVSHTGWGSHPRALWNAIAFQDPMEIIGQDGRTAYGTTLLALGENAAFGGSLTTGCHQDFALRHQRFFLDGELIADSGTIIPADLQ